MQQLMGEQLGPTPETTSFLRELFLARLPANVRMVLASADATTELGRLAEMADKVLEVATPTVAAVTTPPPQPSEVAQLREDVARLTELVHSLTTKPRHRHHSRNRRSPSPAATQQSQDSILCWYHQKFGDRAVKCRDPCSRGLNGQASH